MGNEGMIAEGPLPPLRKRTPDGELYARPDDVERLLAGLRALPVEDVLARAAIRDRRAPGWIGGECLVHFVRACAAAGDQRSYGRFYSLLAARVVAQLPRVDPAAGMATVAERVRDHVVDRLVGYLAKDRDGYCERLDFWEARFDRAVKLLKLDAFRSVLPAAAAEEELGDDDPAQPPPEGIEDPFGLLDPARDAEEDFRNRALDAINALPTEQREILVMRAHGVPIESADPGVDTICGRLGKSSRMVRILQARAHATVREAVREDVR